MLDDLRRAAQEEDEDVDFGGAAPSVKVQEDKLFGMTAIERMFLSIGFFGVVLVISVMMLLATDSVGF
jgi:hypothetical protein